MSDLTGKQIWSLKIDNDFKELIRPLFKNEYLQLEENLLSDGCREPIAVWNGVIVDGHNRYKICTKHGIPFAIEELSFSCREEAIAWICANQLGRRNLTEESRKYLIGKQYESEKAVSRKKNSNQGHSTTSIEPTKTRMKTGARIAEENHISHGTVEKYAIYSRAIEKIQKTEPQIAVKILSGKYKISHNGVIALSHRSSKELQELNLRLERNQSPFTKYQETREAIHKLSPSTKIQISREKTIKDMPEFDPDAEVVGLTLTIPSWSGSIARIVRSDLNAVSDTARANLFLALNELKTMIDTMIVAIRKE